jgi:hypothetical protein
MTRTELLINLIKDHLDNKRFITVDNFRDMFINRLPGQLAFLAISRDGERVLPVFENTFFNTDELIDYTRVRDTLGDGWTPLITAHIWDRLPGTVPQTLLTTDGIIDEKLLVRIFGNRFNWNRNINTVHGLNFGRYDITTLPRLMLYTIDLEGARRIRTHNDTDEGRVFGIHLDTFGNIRYLDRETGRTMYTRFEIGRDTFDWIEWKI